MHALVIIHTCSNTSALAEVVSATKVDVNQVERLSHNRVSYSYLWIIKLQALPILYPLYVGISRSQKFNVFESFDKA